MVRCSVVIGPGLCRLCWRWRSKVTQDAVNGGAGLPPLGKAWICNAKPTEGLERGRVNWYVGGHCHVAA